MSLPHPTLLDRARRYLACKSASAAGVAALAAVPLASAAPAQAGYLHKWTYAHANLDSSSGTARSKLVVSDAPGGSKLTGSVQYSLNASALTRISAGYSGLGGGEVESGDAAEFTWNFVLTEVGSAPVSDLQWSVVAYYDSFSGPLETRTLASGSGFGTFTGSGSLPFMADVSDITWFGADLRIAAVAPTTTLGQYQFDVAFAGDGIRYTYVPEPAAAGTVLMLSCLFALRRVRPTAQAER